MGKTTEEILKEHLDKRPKEVREAIIKFDVGKAVDKIASEHSLNDKQIEVYEGEVTMAIVGARHPNNLQENLTEPDGGKTFSPMLAKELHAAFYTQILEPIMQDAERRGYSFNTENKQEKSDYTQNNETLFHRKNILVTRKTFEQGAHSYPVRNISKVVDYDIWNMDFSGVVANGGIFILGLFGLTVSFVLVKILSVLAILLGGFNLYNMLSTPKHYIVSQ